MKLNPFSRSREEQLERSVAMLTEAVGQGYETSDFLQERLAELELALEDNNWLRLDSFMAREFSRGGLAKIIQLARMHYLKNPLIRHAVNVQAHYVFGQGVNIKAGHPTLNDIIQRFWDDPGNRKVLTSPDALLENERELAQTGNVFFALFSDEDMGRVSVRSIPVEEIQEIICNPEDAAEPWYYKRVWNAPRFDYSGETRYEQRTAYYPDWRFKPDNEQDTIGDKPVMWDAPVYHLRAGGLKHMRFGVPEVYAALDWARAVKEDLEDFSTIRRALSRFAYKLTTPGGKKGVAAARAKLGTTIRQASGSSAETNPSPVSGSTFVKAEGVELEPMQTRNAGIFPEDARRLWLMVSAAVGIPETILSGNADVGNLATAKTLDRPTELQMRARQETWKGVLADILDYVIVKAATANNSPLKGEELDDPVYGTVLVIPNPESEGEADAFIDRSVTIDFPDILERSATDRIDAIVKAVTLDGKAPAGTLGPEMVARLLLTALGVDDVDKQIEALFPEGEETANESRMYRVLTALEETARNGAKGHG